jgi:hypothetical protein
MLKALNSDQAQFVALLAKAARVQRDRLLGSVAEDDLIEVKAARGEHNPTAAIGLAPDPAGSSQLAALREAIASLPADGRVELYALMRIGQGDLAVRRWHRGITDAAALADDVITASLMEDSDLHDHVMKGLYEAKLVS